MVFRMLHHCQRTACYKISLCDHKNFSFYISQCLHYTEQSVNAIKKVAFENICCLFSHTNTPPPLCGEREAEICHDNRGVQQLSFIGQNEVCCLEGETCDCFLIFDTTALDNDDLYQNMSD